jgi:hypothetical protein
LSAWNSRLRLGWKALKELGPAQLVWYALYQAGLRSGCLQRRTQAARRKAETTPTGEIAKEVLKLPDWEVWAALLDEPAKQALLRQAQEVRSGKMRQFESTLTPIILSPEEPLVDWTQTRITAHDGDPKFTWEAGRFGWIYLLAQAYWLNRDESWVEAFWELSENFFQNNPPYRGAQWVSGQEVALRLISLVFASQVFAQAKTSTPARMEALARQIAIHAMRIPPTLAYAHAQNNNHLLSEAAGLFSAGMALPEHPQAARWRQSGWNLMQHGLLSQIAPDGVYIQHSANYHRLMLQLAMWVVALGGPKGFGFSQEVCLRLQAATTWLAALLDPASGGMPNLGPNDGAYILRLTQGTFSDYRPVLQAAWRMCFNEALLPPGKWDDLGLWLGFGSDPAVKPMVKRSSCAPMVLPHPQLPSWVYLRAAQFTARPGHADQLHFDLWWRGANLAADAGTYRYTAPSPWDNALAHSEVHNTVTVDGLEQMQRAGRFLYLDWAQAEQLECTAEKLSAQHNGFRKLGLTHQRSVTATAWGWRVEDRVLPEQEEGDGKTHTIRLHWLLPDWEWKIMVNDNEVRLWLGAPAGKLEIIVTDEMNPDAVKPGERLTVLARAGEAVYGEMAGLLNYGWVSPVYGSKVPALSLITEIKTRIPIGLTTDWHLTQEEEPA